MSNLFNGTPVQWRRWLVEEFVKQILHGSSEHQQWLKDAGEEYIVTGKVTIEDGEVTRAKTD